MKPKSAVIVIDMINGMERWIPKATMKGLLPRISHVLEAARAKGMPIIYIIHSPLGKAGTRIYRELTPYSTDFIVTKEHYSSFYNTKLDALLKKLKVNQLLITGVSTHWCVLTTTVDASYRGYRLVLLKDCVAAPTNKWHKWAIKWLEDTVEVAVKASKEIAKIIG